jgi:hypothetical protein
MVSELQQETSSHSLESHTILTGQSFMNLESMRHRLFTRLGELSAILSKDHHKNLAEVAEHTTLERSWTKRMQKKKL